MIRYRKATDTDFELTFQIKTHSIRPYVETIWSWDDQVQLDYHVKDFKPENIQIILDNNDKEIGLINVTENDELTYIKSILIHSSAQGKGVGTKVTTDIIQRSRLANKRVELQVFKINKLARVLYEKLGFKITGQTDLHYKMTCN